MFPARPRSVSIMLSFICLLAVLIPGLEAGQGAVAHASAAQERHVTVEHLHAEANTFLRDYRHFLACCATDHANLQQARQLEKRAADLLHAAENNLSSGQVMIKFREVLIPVTQAHRHLQELTSRLNQLHKDTERARFLDYESRGRLKRKIQKDRADLQQRVQPPDSQAPGRTGTRIEDSTLPTRAGPNIGNTK